MHSQLVVLGGGLASLGELLLEQLNARLRLAHLGPGHLQRGSRGVTARFCP